MITTLQLPVIAVVQLFLVGPGAGQSCLPFEPEVVTLSGTLTVRAFPGRPHYEDTVQGDEPEHVWILRLDRAVCVEPDSSSRPLNDPQDHVLEIQLAVVGDSLLPRVRSLVGHRITARGQLFSAETGHHHTPVLMLLRDLRAA
jgi:Domain of unknown function (DUF4431)